MNQSTQPVAIITGTSSGIGLALAISLAKANWRVVATMRDVSKSQALCAAADKARVSVDVEALDVTNEHSVTTAVGNIVQKYGKIDALINNAGAGFRGTLEQTTMAEFKSVMDVNFFGVVRMTQAIMPHFRQMGGGRIVTLSSIGGVAAVPFNDAYCAAKFAVEGLMESFAPTASAFGVHISLIEPGPVSTDFANNMAHGSVFTKNDPYAELLNTFLENRRQRFNSMNEQQEDVANVILNALTSPTPNLRYQTSSGSTAIAAQTRADPSGNAFRNAMQGLLGLS